MELSYASRLQGYLYLCIGVAVFMLCVGIALFVFTRKNKQVSRLSLLGVGVLILILYLVVILPLQQDIAQCSYIKYTGAFYVEECITSTKGHTYIFISEYKGEKAKRYLARCDVKSIADDTEYIGTFVYTERSKCLVDISTNGVPE